MSDACRCIAELPDPFRFEDGSRVATPEDWTLRRREITAKVLELEYGGLPPVPESLDVQLLHDSRPRRFPRSTYAQYRLVHGGNRAFHFRLDVHRPEADGPVPVVLAGDGCWLYATDEVRREVLGRGFALALFSRTEIVPDIAGAGRTTGLYPVYPDHHFGALSAWAWGYHRAIDALERIEGVDAARIAITGHSRGGKTVLLAGATDERIAVTAPNASGAGGTGSYLYQGPGCERIANLMVAFPFWFGPAFGTFAEREAELPFDQHFLRALVAPRAQLNTNGYDDLWANPAGAWQTHMATQEVYGFLGVEDRIGQVYRPGGHDHSLADWRVFLDFAQWQLCGVSPERSFADNPYPGEAPAFAWRAPGGLEG